MRDHNVVILGGGPAGVGAAYQLRRLGRAKVQLVEQRDTVGGNAGSFSANGLRLDYGSHRLHSSTDPAILQDIKALIGNDLLHRPRNGRIRLRGRWLRFPLKPADLIARLDPGFAFGVLRDMAASWLPRAKRSGGSESFASVLHATLGPTICRDFYFPYAKKIWGRNPEELSATSARRRVSASTFTKLIKRVLKPPGSGFFYYPRNGFGQISEVYAMAATSNGADLLLGWKVNSLTRPENGAPWRITVERSGAVKELTADHVWSTLPIPIVARIMSPAVDKAVLDAAAKIDYRAMLLVYLHLDVDQFTPTDAHYFPELSVRFSRVSEPKNYAARTEPHGRTTLCAEIPCDVGDETWSMTDAELMEGVAADLATAGLPLPRPPIGVTVRRLSHAYPIYTRGYEDAYNTLLGWADSIPNFLTYGRQGLFAHDNTHHALFMAYAAADCLEAGSFNASKWAEYKKVFATHVVED